MVNCPRCQQPVDDTARASCPVCFAPLAPPAPTPGLASLPVPTVPALPRTGAPMPIPAVEGELRRPIDGARTPVAPPQHLSVPAPYSPSVASQASTAAPPVSYGQPLSRTALTGEVVETVGPGAPAQYGAGSQSAPRSGYGPAPSPGGLPTLPDYIAQGAAPSGTAPYRPTAGYRASNGWNSYLKIRVAVAVVGLIIGGFAWAARWVAGTSSSNPAGPSPFAGLSLGGDDNPEAGSLRTPEGAAQAAMQALHSRDWRKVYYVCAFETDEHKTKSDAEDFERELGRAASMNSNPLTIFNLMAAATQYYATGVNEHGNMADVATSWTIPYEGETISLHGSAHLIRQGKVWMLNLTGRSGNLDEMLGQVTSRTGHGPVVTIPHFGPFAPHSFPSPPVVTRPPMTPPFARYPAGIPTQGDASGRQAGSQPGTGPPGVPGPAFGSGPRVPAGPGFVPSPRFGPGGYMRGPRFGPQSSPGYGGSASPGGGFGNAPGSNGVPPPPGSSGFGGGYSGAGGASSAGGYRGPDGPPSSAD